MDEEKVIILNGEPKEVAAETLAELMVELEMADRPVAVERNRSIVSRSEYGATQITTGDEIEIVEFIGGG